MEISPKPMKKVNFCRLWANFCQPLADESFYVSCIGHGAEEVRALAGGGEEQSVGKSDAHRRGGTG
jgi:hypothetical protein